uniref:Uncharacterized protein n=1 Tax=Corvus moneduloides TaxID=1196302 RepID=A0A8C3EBZ5_CORMO
MPNLRLYIKNDNVFKRTCPASISAASCTVPSPFEHHKGVNTLDFFQVGSAWTQGCGRGSSAQALGKPFLLWELWTHGGTATHSLPSLSRERSEKIC